MNPKILVVDDTPANLFSIEIVLEDFDYELFFAESGEEAIEIFKQHSFYVVLLDVRMPIMDGFETAKHLLGYDAKCPIIFLTASETHTNDIVKGYEKGCVDYIIKPINEAVLVAKIKSVIAQKTREQEMEEKAKVVEVKMEKTEAARSMLETEIMEAGDFQKKLLPEGLPEPFDEMISLETWYHPFHKIGGDQYYFWKIDDENLAVAVWDVSGHGITASLTAVSVFHVLDCIIKEKKIPKHSAKVFDYLNDEFQSNAKNMQFLCAYYAVYNIETKTLSFSISGFHKHILLRNAELQKCEAAGSVPLGMMENSKYEETKLEIKQGDRLLIFSDGLIECCNKKQELFGRERLEIISQENAHLPLSEFKKQIVEKLYSWGDKVFDDDCTLVILEF